jgi:sialate O-acetylesterase
VYRSVEFKDGRAMISFDHADGGLTTLDHKIEGLEVAGADQRFMPAQYRLHGDGRLEVWNDDIPDPKAVRYGWSDWLIGHLYNAMELPASSFRTDNWPVE